MAHERKPLACTAVRDSELQAGLPLSRHEKTTIGWDNTIVQLFAFRHSISYEDRLFTKMYDSRRCASLWHNVYEGATIIVRFTRDCSRNCSGFLLHIGCDHEVVYTNYHNALVEYQGRCGISLYSDTTLIRFHFGDGCELDWWSATSAGKYRECVQNANNILSIIPFSKASFLNREAHNVLLLFGLSEILIMQAPVPECSESEDDEVDPPLTASRSDSGTISSWDAATCGKCTTAYWYKRDLEVSILALLMNFGEYLWYIKNRLFLNLW